MIWEEMLVFIFKEEGYGQIKYHNDDIKLPVELLLSFGGNLC